MAKKEILRGAAAALFGGNSQPEAAVTDNRPQEAAAVTIEEEVITETSPEEEEDLINSIEDEELKAALHAKRMEKRGRPPKAAPIRRREAEIYTRTTFVISREQLAKLKEICFLETITIKDIMNQLIGDAISKYEETHGEIKPKEHKGDVRTLFK